MFTDWLAKLLHQGAAERGMELLRRRALDGDENLEFPGRGGLRGSRSNVLLNLFYRF
jgi:hypothetical protein